MSIAHGSDGEAENFDWKKLYKENSPVLYGYLVKRVGQELGADILQESFLRLFQVMDKNKRVDNPKAYLFQIARNLVIKNFSRNYNTESADLPVNIADKKADSEAGLYKKELQGLLESARQTLSQTELEIYDLRWHHGFIQKDIASILGKSERQIRRDIEKIVHKIRDVFTAAGWRNEDMGIG
jgi:RNA polymerase sigma factor (sigma-70 family)